jgi:Flp pilus assembly protein TadB
VGRAAHVEKAQKRGGSVALTRNVALPRYLATDDWDTRWRRLRKREVEAAWRPERCGFEAERQGIDDLMLFLVVVAVVLIVGILLAPLGAGMVVVATLILLGIVGLAIWGLFFARSRRSSRRVVERGRGLDTPELLGPGGPDDPHRNAPPPVPDTERQRVDVGARR